MESGLFREVKGNYFPREVKNVIIVCGEPVSMYAR